MDLPPGLPPSVLERLGPAPHDVSGEGETRVLMGNGLIAKAGPAEAMGREHLVLVELRAWMPVGLPEVADAGDTWLLLHEVAVRAHDWSGGDVIEALSQLASLHAAFAGHPVLADTRLRDPLGRDREALLVPARSRTDIDALLPGAARLAGNPTPLIDEMARWPATLLHGDPWPLNVVHRADGRAVWLDWAGAAVGPAALDVATWIDQTRFAVDAHPEPLAQISAYCRAAGVEDVDGFERAVAAATLWWFLAVDAPRMVAEQLDAETAEQIVGPRRSALARLGLGP